MSDLILQWNQYYGSTRRWAELEQGSYWELVSRDYILSWPLPIALWSALSSLRSEYASLSLVPPTMMLYWSSWEQVAMDGTL